MPDARLLHQGTVCAACRGLRLSDYLRQRLGLSAALIRQLKRTPCGIQLDGQTRFTDYRLQGGERITLRLADDTAHSVNVQPVCLPLSIVLEDEHYIVLNKPPHMPTHPAAGSGRDTLANAVAWHFRDAPFIFRSLNRLDRDTSGLVLAAKHKGAAHRQAMEIHKEYCAITAGVPAPPEGVISLPLFRPDPMRNRREIAAEGGVCAVTHYKTERDLGDMAFVSFVLETGRTHQIRVHMASRGTPVLGDAQYGAPSPLIGRQALHCRLLQWVSPTGKAYRAEAPLPQDMQQVLAGRGG